VKETQPIFLLGIAGCSGSGKTYLSKQLLSKLGPKIAQEISVDSYYNCQDHLEFKERCKTNYDHPASLELSLLLENLKKLKIGEAVEIPVYDFAVHNRTNSTQLINSSIISPSKCIIVEGILTFHLSELKDIFHYKIFVDTPIELCLERRLARDIVERGRTEESVYSQWKDTVLPMYNEYCAPTSKFADEIYKGDIVDDIFINRITDKILTTTNIRG